MKGFIEEFKAFAIKGNVVDLAVAVVIGAAFGKIVSSLVTNIVMPAIEILLGGIDFSTMSFTVKDSVITYGVFIQSIIDFFIVAFVIFLVIKTINHVEKLTQQKKEEKEEKLLETPENIKLLREIRDSLNKN